MCDEYEMLVLSLRGWISAGEDCQTILRLKHSCCYFIDAESMLEQHVAPREQRSWWDDVEQEEVKRRGDVLHKRWDVDGYIDGANGGNKNTFDVEVRWTCCEVKGQRKGIEMYQQGSSVCRLHVEGEAEQKRTRTEWIMLNSSLKRGGEKREGQGRGNL